MVRGLTWQYGRHDKLVVGSTNRAIERTTSKAKIEVISRGGHLACKVLRVVESLILVSVLNRFLVHELVSRIYPQQEHKQRKYNKTREMHKQHDAKHV